MNAPIAGALHVSRSRKPTFDEFVHASGQRLYRTAVLLCGDHHQAQDLTQATFTKVFVKWRTVARADDPVAYARSVLTNLFISERRLKRSSEIVTDEPEVEASAEAHDPATRLDLLQALARLSAADRTVLVLRYWEDQSAEQTARALGISPASCRKRVSRALTRLRAHIPDLDVSDS